MREGIILKIEIPCIDTFVEVDEEGRIELPQQKFSPTELKTIARIVSKQMRQCNANKEVEEVL